MRGYILALGTIISGYWLMLFVGGLFNRSQTITAEGLAVGIFVIVNTIGMGLSYKFRRIGPIINITAGAGFSIFAYFSANSHKWQAILVTGIPFILVGSLLLLTYRFGPKKR